VSSSWGGLGIGAIAVFHLSRRAAKINAYISTGKKMYQGVKGYARAKKLVKATSLTARTGRYLKDTKIGKFVRYPLTVLKNYKNWKKIKNANSALRGWKAVRYIAFGKQLRALGKTASLAARGSRILGGVAKWSNPIGWVLLTVDAVGSAMNYTSDNQAPSWDPIIGGEGDAMVAYTGDGGLCPNASNSFTPEDIKIGETITLCWTQNPESGFAMALSFVMSNSTRTTMNITKISNFPGLSMFLINSVNYKGIWDEIKGFDLRFLFIKNATYSEGYSDDNIGTYFLGAKSNPDSKDGVLPISYYGHTDFTTFVDTATKMGDQLVIVEKNAPKTFYFHFEDSESNIINVTGSKITDEDLENASEEEVRSFFTVEPTSSYIGNPDEETEEEKAERESLEASARSSSGPSDELEEENPDSPEKVELASNENYKWYSSIEESKPITSFSEFKLIKESLLLEKDPPIEGGTPKQGVEELPTEVGGKEEKTPELGDIKGTTLGSQIMTAKEMGENFEKALNTIDEPIPFCIYFVENREYADPELRDIYQPGSFMNFSLLPDAMNAPDGADIEGGIQVNNLDVLLDVKKGLYNFSEKDRETKLKDTDIEGGDSKATNTILTADISSARNKESITPSGRGEKEEIKTTLQRMNPDQLSQLEISDWEDITSIKIIRDDSGNPETIKIKNRKAELGNKSRTIEKGEPGWESALALAKADNDREAQEQKLELAKR
jgi:hypothetical protein